MTTTDDNALRRSPWFVAAESGWGINLTHQGDTIFTTWFIYDVNGNQR